MNVEIRGIRDAGVPDKERLVLHVLAALDIGHYAVFASSSLEEGVSNVVRYAYWFPDKAVKAGDLIILYSKAGADIERKSETDSVSHFFYWGAKEAVWGTPDACAVLLHVSEWTATPPPTATR